MSLLLFLTELGQDHHPEANPGGPGRLKAKKWERPNMRLQLEPAELSCAVVQAGWTRARTDAAPFR